MALIPIIAKMFVSLIVILKPVMTVSVSKNLEDYAEYGPCENITVTGCTLVSTSAAVKFGSESTDDFRNIVIDSCVIHDSHRGLAIQLRDQGNIENVIFSNCIVQTRHFFQKWWGNQSPFM